MRRHQLTRRTAKAPGSFAPFFDWAEPGDELTVGAAPDADLPARIVAACEEWMRRGGVLTRCHFGVKTVRVTRDASDRLTGFYETQKHCCPLAPLVDGLPSRFNPVADFALTLGVDHLWVLGFIHGFDKTEIFAGRRAEQFKESLSYMDGYAAGKNIASQFYVIDLGWEG